MRDGRTDKRQTREDKATQPLDAGRLSFAINEQLIPNHILYCLVVGNTYSWKVSWYLSLQISIQCPQGVGHRVWGGFPCKNCFKTKLVQVCRNCCPFLRGLALEGIYMQAKVLNSTLIPFEFPDLVYGISKNAIYVFFHPMLCLGQIASCILELDCRAI